MPLPGVAGVAACFAGAGSLSVLDTFAESNMNCGGPLWPSLTSLRNVVAAIVTSEAVSGSLSEPVVRGT